MAEYEKEFNHLSKYAPESVLTEAFRCRQFEDGLNESIKGYWALVTSLQQVNFYQLGKGKLQRKWRDLRQAAGKDSKIRGSPGELLSPQGRELENHKQNQFTILLPEEEGKGLV